MSIFFTILALAMVYVLGSTFFTIELERLIEQTITPYIISNSDVSSLNQEVYSGIGQFMNSNHVQLIGYTCIILMVLIALLGLITQKKGLTILGSMAFILPTYAYFILHMSFLAGLGILTALWAPFWGDLVRLGDVAYLPYMTVVYPFSLVGLDIRRPFIGLINDLGLLLFILGVLAWFYARFQKKGTANFWIYRFTRHPQYLGWIVWSYGLMLQVALRKDTVFQNVNPGASLP